MFPICVRVLPQPAVITMSCHIMLLDSAELNVEYMLLPSFERDKARMEGRTLPIFYLVLHFIVSINLCVLVLYRRC